MEQIQETTEETEKHWRLLPAMTLPGAEQMAIDEAILEARSEGQVPNTLRFYSWRPRCVTIGYFQDAQREVNLRRAATLGVDVVRRLTGGGAVFHDKELTYSLIIDERDAPADIVESYHLFCGIIADGLRKIGVQARFHPINDLLVNGRKISGNAQTRRGGALLQHGTILLDTDHETMFSLLTVAEEKNKERFLKNAKERVTSLREELGRNLAPDEIADAITSAFRQRLGISFAQEGLTTEEKSSAARLREKYGGEEWLHAR